MFTFQYIAAEQSNTKELTLSTGPNKAAFTLIQRQIPVSNIFLINDTVMWFADTSEHLEVSTFKATVQ
jgi:hypothetical protein